MIPNISVVISGVSAKKVPPDGRDFPFASAEKVKNCLQIVGSLVFPFREQLLAKLETYRLNGVLTMEAAKAYISQVSGAGLTVPPALHLLRCLQTVAARRVGC